MGHEWTELSYSVNCSMNYSGLVYVLEWNGMDKCGLVWTILDWYGLEWTMVRAIEWIGID